jgi:hypothetical protein
MKLLIVFWLGYIVGICMALWACWRYHREFK